MPRTAVRCRSARQIAIRALSPAVNDTFTALTCIDWLGGSLCKITTRWHPIRVHRDSHGYVRVITAHVSFSSCLCWRR
ncbi:MAG: DUF2254 family protein [Solirubrobacteraceae bacterium]